MMKRQFIYFVLFNVIITGAAAQSDQLFNDSIVSSIYISISQDSLKQLYDSVLSDHYYKVCFVFQDGKNSDTLENTGFRLRGNTSRFSKKKSFKISFNEYVPGRKYQGVKKINLNGEHNDPTLIREKLFYDLWKKAGMVERRTNFIKVFINDQYYGLYTNLEEMDKDWLDRVFPDKSGNLYKCTYPADLVFLGTNQQTYKDLKNGTVTGGRVYDLQTNEAADDYTNLVSLITQLNKIPDEEFIAQISKILETGHFLKALAIDVATGNWDDYSFNKNNYYLYDNPSSGKFEFITYDPDNTFGVDWFQIDWATRDYRSWINSSFSLPLASKLLKINSFFEQYRDFLDTLNQSVIFPDSVFPRIDYLKQLIQQAAEADPYRKLDYGYSISDFNNSYNMKIDDHTPYGLKPFFLKRHETLTNQLHPSSTGNEISPPDPMTIYPNPVTDKLNFRILTQQDQQVVIKVLDISGKSVKEKTVFKGNEFTISVNDLIPGFYLLQILLPDGFRWNKPFLKQNLHEFFP